MSSIIHGYEYDIFISYRQKDNKGDRWVSEFVDALKDELESTFKEEVSVYFDINPHDGLLETHNVDASLKEKLKCLIFIPIISQTYCDPKSFAWQHEFCAFNKLAKEDQFGRDIRLSGGNVTSRILPIRIHDLDEEDKTLLEDELGGLIRGIEFIFTSPGVNRPLKPSDNPDKNLNKTYYRDQVNKIANAIKEIISCLKNPSSSIAIPSRKDSSDISKNYPETFESIAVLPFANMSSDPEQEFFSDGISEEIINMLAQVPGLKVAGRTSSFSFKNKNLDLRTIGDLLNVENILEGSIMKSGNRIRITAQLINARDGYHIWSQRYDRELNDIFSLQDDICTKIAEHLKLILEGSPVKEKRPTVSPQAYEMYLKGDYYDKKYTKEGFEKAIEYFSKALKIDPDYADAWWYLGLVNFELHGFLRLEEERLATVLSCANKAISIDPTNPNAHFLLSLVHFNCDYDWMKMNSELELANNYTKTPFTIVFTPLEPWIRVMLYGDFDFAIKRMQEAVNFDPLNIYYQFHLSQILLFGARQYKKSISILKNIMELGFPEIAALRILCLAYLFDKEYDTAEKYALKDYQASEGKGHGAANLIICLTASGKDEEALQLYQQVNNTLSSSEFPEILHVKVNSYIGKIDAAFKYLDKAINEKNYWLFSLKYSPEWDLLRSDPRFEMALEKMKFPESKTIPNLTSIN
jgi:TolB-like protein